MTRKITISQFLNDEELAQVLALYNECRDTPTRFHKRCVDEIIKPNIRRINADLGQENDPDYLAYMVEYAIERSS